MAEVTKITDGSLIAADKVNGTNVYNGAGEKLGSVDDIMLDKKSGWAIYAVVRRVPRHGREAASASPILIDFDANKGGFVVKLFKPSTRRGLVVAGYFARPGQVTNNRRKWRTKFQQLGPGHPGDGDRRSKKPRAARPARTS